MLRFLIEKEFKQIRRNSFVPRILVAMPLAMMLVFPWAANQEIRDVKLSVVDNDHSTTSQRLVGKVSASGYFRLTDVSSTFPEALRSVESGDADIILEIAPGFERDIIEGEPGRVMIAANAVNGTKGTLGTSYLSSILNDYSVELREQAGMQIYGATESAVGSIPVQSPIGLQGIYGSRAYGDAAHDAVRFSARAEHRRREGGRNNRADERNACAPHRLRVGKTDPLLADRVRRAVSLYGAGGIGLRTLSGGQPAHDNALRRGLSVGRFGCGAGDLELLRHDAAGDVRDVFLHTYLLANERYVHSDAQHAGMGAGNSGGQSSEIFH